ncbi:helix-turn-helix domain-containing protein [Micromonospora zamorensis]|uniref:helix-turn-helix domain-containing protein n=1 Tax=Micromonospora zamorensis TaxID=709883 RepID=UPI0039B7702C
MLVEMSVMEQRYRAVQDVLAGSTITDVAERFGVSRQAVHRWLAWYEDEGLEGLADRSSRPRSSPRQTSPEMEALICELRRSTHPRRHRPCRRDPHRRSADTTFRVHDGDQILTEVPRTTVKPIARFKVRKPEPSRRRTDGQVESEYAR